MTTPQPRPMVAIFTNYRLVAVATVVLLCGAPAAVALFADGNILMGLLATLLVGFSAVIVIGFWVTMVLVRRAIKAHGILAAAEQSTALAGPSPATIKIVAVHYVLTGSASAVTALIGVITAVLSEGFGIFAGAVLGVIFGGISVLYFYGTKVLLRRGFPATGRNISGFLTGLFGLGLVRGLFNLDNADDDERLAVIVLAGLTAYVALPLLLLALPPSKAWLARATPAILRTGIPDPQSAQPPWPPSAPPTPPGAWPQSAPPTAPPVAPSPPQSSGPWPQSAPPVPPQGPPPVAPPPPQPSGPWPNAPQPPRQDS